MMLAHGDPYGHLKLSQANMTYRISRRVCASLYACAISPLALWACQAQAQSQQPAVVDLSEVVVTATSAESKATPSTVTASPIGQVQTTIPLGRTANTRAFSVTDLLGDSPGISLKQGNGPRDVGISIRGSNAQNGYGIKNIVMFDDGFPVTQPDGLSRTDLVDPHAYGAVDVIRGPSSALYGNYATGGAIDFRTRRGRDIDGLEIGTDAGSYGYLNNYLTWGRKVGNVEASIFASNVFGDSLTGHSEYNTQTVNGLLTYTLTPEDRLTFKFIENHLNADLSNRLSVDQFHINPYQRGCANAPGAAGCQNVSLYANGYNGAKVTASADQAGLNRNDNRALFGVRYEHDFGAAATWRTQVTIDDRNINQPTGATSVIGDYFSIDALSDVTLRNTIAGLPSVEYFGVFANTLYDVAPTINVVPGGNARLGGTSSKAIADTTNLSVRGREELSLTNRLTLVAGLGIGETYLNGQNVSYAYSAPGVVSSATSVGVNRALLNEAPEVSLVYKPLDELLVKARVATGYGTPQVSNLFITPQGLPGNNTQLKSQTNIGYDLEADWMPVKAVKFTLGGFYEFFGNELISQSAGPSPLQNYTFNAPRSEHRGIEAALDYHFLPGWTLHGAYTYDNQIYAQYVETLSAGPFTSSFNRAGNRIPGVPNTELVVRLGYDIPSGALKGLGAYVEYDRQSAFYLDNANLLKAPGFDLVNVNLHYTHEIKNSSIKSVSAYFEVRNIASETYVASANNITDTVSATTGAQNPASSVAAKSGSIYAGTPRTFITGVRLKF